MKTKKLHSKRREESGGDGANYFYSITESPLGELMLVSDGSALTGLYFVGCDHLPATRGSWTLKVQHPVLKKAVTQLQEYFAGKRESFSLPLNLSGTAFQKRVWAEIARIPYGNTISYSHLAQRAAAPQAIRAAGTTTGRNPVSIIVPCHRVVGKNGSLCGFAGGLERKRQLLNLESSHAKPNT